jgi:hypothetical protein
MAINKIKLKQIDADFSGLVGQYGSGYFVSNNSFYDLNQNGATFYNSTLFKDDTIAYQNSNFTFDTTSLNNFANRVASRLLTVTGNQTAQGIKTFTNGIRVGGGGGSGVLYSGQINPVYVSGVTGDSNRYLTFVENTGNGFKNIQMESGLNYNPSTKVLSASTFRGRFSGNSLSASSSAPLNISAFNSGDSINFNFTPDTPNYTITTGHFGPVGTTATRNLGSSSIRWKEVFASVGTINISDKNLKTEISEIPDAWLDAWKEVDYVRYKFKDAVAQKGLSGARWHIGHIAQNIHGVFNKYNLNAFDIGILCYDRWDESVDQNGNTIPSGEIWSIRPDECQFMEMALMRRSINRLKSGILI